MVSTSASLNKQIVDKYVLKLLGLFVEENCGIDELHLIISCLVEQKKGGNRLLFFNYFFGKLKNCKSCPIRSCLVFM